MSNKTDITQVLSNNKQVCERLGNISSITSQVLLNSKQVCERLGNISSTTLWRYQKLNLIHKPIRPNPRQNFYKPEWVDECIANLEKLSDDMEMAS